MFVLAVGGLLGSRDPATAAGVATDPVASPAYTWSPNSAVSYANSYFNLRNPQYPESFQDDCTNFVSQVMFKGAVPLSGSPTGSGAHNVPSQWWAVNGSWTFSWSVANSLKTFLTTYRGYHLFYQHFGANAPNKTSGSGYALPVFYNWGDSSASPAPIAQHASFLVTNNGTDAISPRWVGSLVDQHTSNRYHAIWHLGPYNQHYKTTSLYIYTL